MNALKQLIVNNKQLLDRIKMCRSEDEFIAELLRVAQEKSIKLDVNDIKAEILAHKSISSTAINLSHLMGNRNNNCFNEG